MTNVATVATRTQPKADLTHRGLESLKPRSEAYYVPDQRCPGLAVRVAPSGMKTWGVAFRIRGTGATRRVSLGPFPAIGLEAARARATALLNAAKVGQDLVAEENAAAATAAARTTVGQLVELYLARMVRGKLRTAAEIELRLKRTLAPLKNKYADEIRRRDLRMVLDAVAHRGVLREAEKQRQVMRSTFQWALSQDLVEIDPSAGLASYGSSPRRDRVLSPAEIHLFWNWLESSGMPRDYADVLRLQLAVGARVGEVGGICVAEIDSQAWTWTLPAARSKNGRPRLTPLLGLAREIVQARLEHIEDGPLFITEDGRALTSNCISSLIVKRRTSIPISHFTSHDLRRTVATRMADMEIPEHVIGKVLGHEAGGREVRTLNVADFNRDRHEHVRRVLRRAALASVLIVGG